MKRARPTSRAAQRRAYLQDLASGWAPSDYRGGWPPRAAEAMEAIRRMDAGVYGLCASCSKKIPAARLEAKPEATLCVDCQSEREYRRAG